MSAKSVSFDPQPCRHRNNGRFGAVLPPPREYCTCVICSGSPKRPGTTSDSRPISLVLSLLSALPVVCSIASLMISNIACDCGVRSQCEKIREKGRETSRETSWEREAKQAAKKEDPGGIGRRGEKGERRRKGSIVGNFKVPGRLVSADNSYIST